MEEFRIPKISVPIVCHTTEAETISGDIFLDIVTSTGFTTAQILEFFNSDQLFFPLRLADQRSIVIRKAGLRRIDVPDLFNEYESEVASLLDQKREVNLYFNPNDKLEGRIIVDMPSDHSRVLDVLNARHKFIPLLLENMIAMINLEHVYKVEEAPQHAAD